MNEARMWRNECVLARSQMGEMYDYIKKELEQYRKDICKAAEEHFFGDRKEVRKKMAIDYKKEWEKLQESTGHCTVVKNNTGTTLGVIMTGQIQTTISNREKLMEEFVKGMFTTEIVESMKDGYIIEVRFKGGPMYGKILITKKEFDTWLKRKEVK